jgi:hypothetical protein
VTAWGRLAKPAPDVGDRCLDGSALTRQDVAPAPRTAAASTKRRLDLLLARQSAHGAKKLSDLASPDNRLGAISAMLKGVPVTLRRPRR